MLYAVNVPAPRLGGWLLLPLARLILTVLTSALVVVMYIGALFNPARRDALFSHDTAFLTQWGLSLATSLAVWLYSARVTGFSASARAACLATTLSGCC